ncbi:hypothetical protein D3C76_1431230 [compost metagenome]
MLRAATLPRAWMAALSTVRVRWRSSPGVIGMADRNINVLCIFTHKVELCDLWWLYRPIAGKPAPTDIAQPWRFAVSCRSWLAGDGPQSGPCKSQPRAGVRGGIIRREPVASKAAPKLNNALSL